MCLFGERIRSPFGRFQVCKPQYAKNVYHLNLDPSILPPSPSWDTLAASTSAHDVHLFDISNGSLTRRSIGSDLRRSAPICGVRFANKDANLLYVATTTGTIYTYDLRTQHTVSQYDETPETRNGGGTAKPLTCFDLNANDRILCAGTEQVGPDTHLLFFDTRKPTAMGAYWESHSDDITQVRFHPTLPDRLATGSADGLINVFDVSANNEDDALEHCLNTERSVQQLQWHEKASRTKPGAADDSKQIERDLLSCITHVNDLQLYDVAESELHYAQDAQKLAQSVRRISAEHCNVVGVHSTDRPGNLFVLAGSTKGRGSCMRSFTLDPIETKRCKEETEISKAKKPATMQLAPGADFQNNKQVLRCSLYNPNVSRRKRNSGVEMVGQMIIVVLFVCK